MAKTYIVDTTPAQLGSCEEVLIQVNAALTGTIKVIDGTSGTTANVATITNPGVGNLFRYRDFTSGVRVIASTTCDVTVSASRKS
jgi:hypothetical protein